MTKRRNWSYKARLDVRTDVCTVVDVCVCVVDVCVFSTVC